MPFRSVPLRKARFSPTVLWDEASPRSLLFHSMALGSQRYAPASFNRKIIGQSVGSTRTRPVTNSLGSSNAKLGRVEKNPLVPRNAADFNHLLIESAEREAEQRNFTFQFFF